MSDVTTNPQLESRISEIVRRRESAEDALALTVLWNNLGVICEAAGRLSEADLHYQRGFPFLESILGPNDVRVAQNYSNRAAVCRKLGILAEAERLFQLAARIWDRSGWPKEMPGIETLSPDVGDDFLAGTPLWSERPVRGDFFPEYGRIVSDIQSDAGRVTKTIESLRPWYHNIPLTKEIQTNPSNPDYPASRWRIIEEFVPKDLKGKTVLDIGCNSGFFSLEMKKRGADRVVGVDIMPHILAQARFASHWYGLPLELREVSAYDVEQLGTFDHVVFIGVLYHLKHPLYALEKIAAVCKDTMYFQSVVRGVHKDFTPIDDYEQNERAVFDRPEFPKMYFIEKSLNGDESNWWFATRSCLKAMLRTAGFRDVQDTGNSEIFICRK